MVITIDNLATATIEAGKDYRLAQKRHVISSPVIVQDNVSIECGEATIAYNNPGNPPAWSVFKRKNVRIGGGAYVLGPKNYVAFLEHGSDYYLDGAVLESGSPGGLAIVRGSRNVVIQDCTASIVTKYLVFLEGGNVGVTLDQLALDQGSLDEAGIRILDSWDVTISNCDITTKLQGKKNSALRMQDGNNFRVIGGRFNGGFGAGPLADGDGGRMIGITRWYLKNGKTADSTTQPPDVDLAKTASKRADAINARMKSVSVVGTHIDGPITLEAGLENYRQYGGTITTPAVFTGITWRYPERDEWTKPCDTIRPQASGQMIGVNIKGDVRDNPIGLIDCVVNGVRQSIPATKK